MNNVGGRVADKHAFESRHKFSICFENGAHSGYTTEKLVQAFEARTVPIYWGDPRVGEVFNKRAFIDASDFDSLDQVAQLVKELDNDDERYMAMLREPALLPSTPAADAMLEKFERWLLHIFEQPLDKAQRRNREMHGQWYVQRRQILDPAVYEAKVRARSKWTAARLIGGLRRRLHI